LPNSNDPNKKVDSKSLDLFNEIIGDSVQNLEGIDKESVNSRSEEGSK